MKFRQMVYAKDEASMETAYENLTEAREAVQYPKFLTYMDTMYNMRENWCLCYRNHLPMRGNNTNNFVEAQFLVLKDNVLNRTREVNVNGLFEKLTGEFIDHYKNKLLSVANGRFDGIYSRRFQGKGKKSNDSCGFNLLSEDQIARIEDSIRYMEGNIYTVASFTKNDRTYVVDMDSGICECLKGQCGSVCKHQYFIWVRKISSNPNFLPLLSGQDRRKYSYIAIGEYMPDHFYVGLHDFVHEAPVVTESLR